MIGPKNINTESRSVLVITHYYGAHGGGIERVAERLIQEIAARHEFRFVWAASDIDGRREHAPYMPLPMRTFNLIERAIGIPWPLWGPGSLKRLKQAVAEAEIVWLHDTLYPGNLLAFFWARRSKKPIVITQHIGPVPYRNPFLRGVMRLADRLFTQPMLKAASQTLFISDRVAEDYYSKVRFTKPVKIVPNGVDLRTFQPPLREKRNYLREQFALKSDQPVLLFAGRFVEKKGLRVIRHLASLLPGWRFWLAGRGPVNPDRWLLPNVHVFRDRGGPSLAELYQAADLLILPSYGEGFPLVIQEALACGLPVMCSPKTASGSFLAKPFLHLVDVWPENPRQTADAWARKLQNLTFSLPLKDPMTELADFAQTHWDWRPVAEVYAGVFHYLLKKA
jgi:glycosyltransferase involved in cell wall biosynthesis